MSAGWLHSVGCRNAPMPTAATSTTAAILIVGSEIMGITGMEGEEAGEESVEGVLEMMTGTSWEMASRVAMPRGSETEGMT